MGKIAEIVKGSRKVVLKIGSSVLSDDEGAVNRDVVKNIVDQVQGLREEGKQVILVSSGAGICGVGAINKWARRDDINYKQALCAIGQVELMIAYREHFKTHGVIIGQMLLTQGDFDDSVRNLNIRNTLFTLVDEGVVPVINENDSVGVEEMKIGDNDMLAAYTAALWNADLLVLMSDIDGVFDKSPKENPDARLIREVYDLNDLSGAIHVGAKSDFGTGGIMTKIAAAREVNQYNIPLLLVNGKKRDILLRAGNEDVEATIFLGMRSSSER
jgi:glutamate 5-kinase